MRIQRLQTRIIVFFVALLALVQLAAFVFVNAANSKNARAKVEEELNVGQRVFARLLEQNADKLKMSARVLAADFAFREAIATHDDGTIASALANHGARIGANAMLFVDLDGNVVTDTLRPQSSRRAFEYPALLSEARPAANANQANASMANSSMANSSMEILDGRAFQLVATPVLAPLPIGWVVMGFAVDDAVASDLRQLTELEVTFALNQPATPGQPQGRWRVLASTLSRESQGELLTRMPARSDAVSRLVMSIADVEHQALVIPLDDNQNARIVAVLHRSLGDALAAFERLRFTLIILALLSLAMSIIGSVAVARNITRPLETLASAASRIEQGDYSAPVVVQRADEIGVLASSLNHMRGGIADREKHILKLAYEDPLTDLANRSRFADELEHAIAHAAQGGVGLAILMMDLDRFKYVNDTLGHGVGDHVLREVSSRLQRTVTHAECIARLGGDEFAILVKYQLHPGSGTDFSDTARAIINALEEPILYEGQPLDVGTSIGIAHFPEHGRDAQTLVRNADIAMYAAKRNKTGFATYDAHYDTSQQEHLSLLGELRRAVERNELRLYYQPKVSLHTSHIGAVEALIRWEHPTRGLVPPCHFIPFAEHTGYIKLLTRWVLREAVRQCGEWLRQDLRLQVSVNLSARDLMNRDLPDQVSALLVEHAVPAALLCLEITESGFMDDPAHAQKVLDRLFDLGVKLSIDDYGTGYSSLSYIMRLPVQELKIDRSFISRMATDEEISTIVRSTIDLGHNLGLKVVAEGVEDQSAWNILRSLGCDDAQGYFMSKPLSPDLLAAWIRANEGNFQGVPGSRGDARGSETAATGTFRRRS
ncbi:MAG TPA: EAL domain-containing protein [Steroidobacteraceae bacterium]|nr:EAL domain-containing protein [Steroidobacteraceae bacterium]